MIDYARKSLEGLWVGDCVGNLGQLYFAHDILKALSEGVAKFGGKLSNFKNQFVYSDDTEEGIVLYNHLTRRLNQVDEHNDTIPNFFNGKSVVVQDELAMGFATRYMERDPDGEIYGYGLNTRKVLRDIYEGIPWTEANKFIKSKSEGMPSHIDSLVDSLAKGHGMKTAMHEVNLVLERAKKGETGELQGSCGNGSAMRVGPLGAFLATHWSNKDGKKDETGLWPFEKRIVAEAALQAEVTHCHPEGIAGAIAITSLAYDTADAVRGGYLHFMFDRPPKKSGGIVEDKQFGGYEAEFLNGGAFYYNLLRRVPRGQVWDGIKKAQTLPYNTPLMEVIKVLGNGSHVTCQDTVPICCWLAIKAMETYPIEEMYEKAIIETSMAFGDVDTNCAIVGGIVGLVCPPPVKWSQFCTPMEGTEIEWRRFDLQNMTESHEPVGAYSANVV